MIFWGMDANAARALAQRLADGATTLDLLRASIEISLNTVPWEGPDAAAFQSDWQRRHSSALARASSLLEQACQYLVCEADNQLVTSAAASTALPSTASYVDLNNSSAVENVATITLPTVPSDGGPEAVSAWWRSLSEVDRDLLLHQHPERLGGLNGLPAHVRDLANRNRLAEERHRAEEQLKMLDADLSDNFFGGMFTNTDAAVENTRNKIAALDRLKATVDNSPERQLLLLDTSGDLLKAAVAIGDVDTADHVAVFTPGLNSTVQDRLTRYVGDMDDLRERALFELHAAGRPETVATVAWLGYEAPQLHRDSLANLLTPHRSVANDYCARMGGQHLARFLSGIHASRVVDPHLTALGHSYGSTATGYALQETSRVDDAIFFGSPGLGVTDADALRLPCGHAYVVEARNDAVADLARFGSDPNQLEDVIGLSARAGTRADPECGSTIPLMESLKHSEYLKQGTTSQYNISVIIAGMPDRAIKDTGYGYGDVIATPLPWAR